MNQEERLKINLHRNIHGVLCTAYWLATVLVGYYWGNLVVTTLLGMMFGAHTAYAASLGKQLMCEAARE